MQERPLSPSDAKIARRNYALLCGTATLVIAVVVLLTVLFLQ